MVFLFVVLSYLSFCTDATDDLSPFIGMGVSTYLQSSPITPETVGNITNNINGKIFRLFEPESSAPIAEQIVAQSSTPSEIKFIIQFWDVNNVTKFHIDNILNRYSSVRSNIWCICFGNEPDLIYWPSFDTLADKLEFMYEYLVSTTEWNHVKVTIPFSGAIFGDEGYFQKKWQSELTKILNILQYYDGPFSMNLYPLFDLLYGGGYTEERLQYALGAAKGEKYDIMLEELYDRAVQSIYHSIGANDIDFILTETGWPTKSTKYKFATVSNAKEYNTNVLKRMHNSTSVLYKKKIVFFEFIDENDKGGVDVDPGLMEKHWGFYDKNWCLKYYIDMLFKEDTIEWCKSQTEATSGEWNVIVVISVASGVMLLVFLCMVICVYKRKRRKVHVNVDGCDSTLISRVQFSYQDTVGCEHVYEK